MVIHDIIAKRKINMIQTKGTLELGTLKRESEEGPVGPTKATPEKLLYDLHS